MHTNYRHALLHDVRHKVRADQKPFDEQGHYLCLCGRMINYINYRYYLELDSAAGYIVCEECERKAEQS